MSAASHGNAAAGPAILAAAWGLRSVTMSMRREAAGGRDHIDDSESGS
jgi:hypothetical protein